MGLNLRRLLHDGNQVAEGDESTGGEDEEEHAVVLGVEGSAKELACAEDLADAAKQCEGDGEAEADADAVEDALHRAVLGCKGFGTTKDDAVHDDEGDEQTEGLIDLGRVGLHEHLQGSDEGGNHDDVRGDAHLIGDEALDARDDEVGEDEDSHRGQTHRHTIHGAGGGSQRGAHTEEKDEGGVLLEDAVPQNRQVFHNRFSFSLVLGLSLGRNLGHSDFFRGDFSVLLGRSSALCISLCGSTGVGMEGHVDGTEEGA